MAWRMNALGGCALGALLLYSLLPARPTPPSAVVDQAKADTPASDVDLGSLDRCGCDYRKATNIYEDDRCQLKHRPDLTGVEGYVKTSIAPVDLGRPPWTTTELKQTGPERWESVRSKRMARTKVRVLETHYDDEFDGAKGRVKVQDVEGGRESWIAISSFEPIAWWVCSPDKAVGYSPAVMRPKPEARPISLNTGRWIDKKAPESLWCWYFVKEVGVYCDPGAKRSMQDDTWIYKPDEVEQVY